MVMRASVLLFQFLTAVPMPDPPPPPAIFRAVQQVESQPVLPAHRRGPHEGEPDTFCYRGETDTRGPRKMYQCACQMLCEDGAGGERLQREADDCETACGKDQCLCHVDQTCAMPMEPPK